MSIRVNANQFLAFNKFSKNVIIPDGSDSTDYHHTGH